ncbi:hypothetical protein LCGC14_0471690 [marine sediment metagenome]|uniref:Uncharacterized protein n=1 Tax=marine sediment metagenome TaxID=412755 RepID=A0A0F9SUY0_9ZZZZ|nr:MAG: hypothetical protein Lokiarch_25320 [Candidatus Lokiarchaeum sp. GC14_75]HEC37611.1 hypothetical protein [bacterium]
MVKYQLVEDEQETKPKQPNLVHIKSGLNILSYEKILELAIEHGKKSALYDYKQISMALEGGDRNSRFQSKRIKDFLRMMFDIGLKISK